MPAHRMGDEPRCTESEFKDDRHQWVEIGTEPSPHHAQRCHACGMWRIGSHKRTGVAWHYIFDGKGVGAAPADGERA